MSDRTSPSSKTPPLSTRSARASRAAPRVALDTEFHNEKSYAAKLMVVQLVIGDEVAIVDPLRVRDLDPLARALERTTIVGHALQSDLKIFADRFGRLPRRRVRHAARGGVLRLRHVDLARGSRLRRRRRPVAEIANGQRLEHAAALGAADRLSRRRRAASVRVAGRARCAVSPRAGGSRGSKTRRVRSSISRATAPIPNACTCACPGAMRMNRRELGILREVARLRDALARERDVPLKYIIPDDVMAGIVSLRPQTRDDLAQLRRLDAGGRKAFGDRIVAAVAARRRASRRRAAAQTGAAAGRRSRGDRLGTGRPRRRDRRGERSADRTARHARRRSNAWRANCPQRRRTWRRRSKRARGVRV